MASDSISVSGPIDIKSSSAESTAFELMKYIANWEGGNDNQQRTRAYWLTLYSQCYKATQGSQLAVILHEE